MLKSKWSKKALKQPAPPPPDQWGRRNSAGVVIASGMRFENVSYKVDDKAILENITLDVEPGKVLCLLGPSGSGKTSLLRIAAGLIENSSGRVLIDGRVVSDENSFLPPERRGVGLVFQDFALFPHLTIRENVEFGLTAMNRTEAMEQAMRILSRVGLSERAEQYPHVLSGGEQQRVALARALAPRPGVLLMDEPFSGLDSRLRDTVREQSLDLLRETRSTAIIVTHDAEEALRVGDHIALIREGKLVQYGSGRDLYYNPANLFAAGFFSEINLVPVAVSDGVASCVFGETESSLEDNSIGFAAIRHTDVSLTPYKAGKEGVPARIVSRRFLGTSELIDVTIEGLETTLQARVRAGKISRDAKAAMVLVDPTDMMIFPSSDI